jgi:hypothetical protein
MTHDPSGRAAPPRCEECNAPLTSDEHRLTSASAHFFCLECQLVLNPFPNTSRCGKGRKKRNTRPCAYPHIAGDDRFVPGTIA